MIYASHIPRDLSGFKEQALSNLQSDQAEGRPPLNIQLIEVNTERIPGIMGCSEWRTLDGDDGWYICNDTEDHYILNKVNGRVWALYSLAETNSFSETVNAWIRGNLMMDNCWTPSGMIRNLVRSANPSDTDWVPVTKLVGDDGTTGEWYPDGRAVIGSSEDVDSVILTANIVSDHYRDELDLATEWRNGTKGSFELLFPEKIDPSHFHGSISCGTGDLRMWMVETERGSEITRFGGVDMHTWDGVLLDVGPDFTYVTIPGNGCVNAVPRLATLEGRTMADRVRIHCDGSEVFI